MQKTSAEQSTAGANICLETSMPQTSPRQRKTTGRVMHEFEHGELKSGPGGKGGKVKSRKQAIAIALSEAGASKYESKSENKENPARKCPNNSLRMRCSGTTECPGSVLPAQTTDETICSI